MCWADWVWEVVGVGLRLYKGWRAAEVRLSAAVAACGQFNSAHSYAGVQSLLYPECSKSLDRVGQVPYQWDAAHCCAFAEERSGRGRLQRLNQCLRLRALLVPMLPVWPCPAEVLDKLR